MLKVSHSVVSKAKKVANHMKKHQHKYLFLWWLAGGIFLFIKIIMLFWASYMFYNASHDASFADDYILEQTTEETETIPEETETTPEETETIPEETETIPEETETIPEETETMPEETETMPEETETIPEETETIPEETETIPEETETIPEETETMPEETETMPEETETIPEETETIPEETETTPEETETIPEETEQTLSVCNYSWFSSNITWSIYSGDINILWTISSACENEIVDIQLYDHNEEWITLERLPWYVTEYNFDTTLLWSWFYLQTWLNFSWEVEVINTWLYSWINMDSWTWYYIRWLVQPDTILHQTQEFAIDNQKPTISKIDISSSWVFSWILGEGKKIDVKFDWSELLTWIIVYFGSGQASVSSWSTWANYVFSYELPSNFPFGNIPYTILYQDFAGNSSVTTWISNFVYDWNYPQITWFNLSGYDFSFTTSKLTIANAFVIIRNTTNGWVFNMTGLSQQHSFSLPTLSLDTNYDLWIVVKDEAGNESKAALELKRNGSWDIEYNLLATLYGQTLTNYSSGSNFLTQTWSDLITWDIKETVVEKFKQEIDKFTECKNNIDYTKVRIQIKWTEIELNIPTFQRSEIKKLVNSFVLYILKNLEESPLSQNELQDLAQKFDSFSVILKLIKDDDNFCKQNLSNYHLEQFKQSLDTYGIDL